MCDVWQLLMKQTRGQRRVACFAGDEHIQAKLALLRANAAAIGQRISLAVRDDAATLVGPAYELEDAEEALRELAGQVCALTLARAPTCPGTVFLKERRRAPFWSRTTAWDPICRPLVPERQRPTAARAALRMSTMRETAARWPPMPRLPWSPPRSRTAPAAWRGCLAMASARGS